ncbi:uncharacterized protein N7496_001316 [Penicillium cataractarum]|uniref:Uncharacterized protein n=1 Tax=Penicillium cataractarum TaxID=2100454 RepID=A0A9W9VVU5_9EURO|nr:uncharacterized protein N7496_001316 [Penicillium cataractarum]KAJ5390248.1 hypothetical protein N7496_001316 [Penicillium cataractarum]
MQINGFLWSAQQMICTKALAVSDLDTLRSIVLSSPICHKAYLMVREELLHTILKASYGEFLDLSEAIIAVRSKDLWLEHHEEQAIALLDRWRRREEIKQFFPTLAAQLYQPGDLEETIKLLRFHTILQFFFEDYTMNLPRPSWIEPARWKQELPIKMSKNEKCRFMRALCRLQIYGNIFGPPEDRKHLCLPAGDLSSDEKLFRLFLGAMPPWEYHEMGCVGSYLQTKYDPVFEKVSTGLRDAMKNDQGRFFWDVLSDDECPPPAVIDRVEDLPQIPTYAAALTFMGPDFLYRALHSTPIPQRNLVIGNLNRSFFPVFDGNFPIWYERIPFTDPADRHYVRHFEQFWSTLPPLEQPNLSWRKLGLVPHTPEQTLENALDMDNDQNLENEWPWGFALWDDARLKKWDAPLLIEGRGDAPLLLLTAP